MSESRDAIIVGDDISASWEIPSDSDSDSDSDLDSRDGVTVGDSTTFGPELPLDLQLQILTHLPARVVLRFRCVSKPWNAGTRSTAFIYQHLARSIQAQSDPRRPTNFLVVPSETAYRRSTAALELPKEENPVISKKTRLAPVPWEHALMHSCHGLLILSYNERRTCILNPATGETVLLPSLDDEDVRIGCIGFGFDPLRKEYKVVGRTRLKNRLEYDGVVVCTIPQHWQPTPWRFLPCPTHRVPPKNPDVVLNGRLHWISAKSGPQTQMFPVILSFDLHNDTLEYISITKVEPRRWMEVRSLLVLTQLDGCLGLVEIYMERVRVWKLMEYCNGESWVLMFAFYSDNLMTFDTLPAGFEKVSCLWKDAKLHICINDRIFSCDSTRQCVVRSKLCGEVTGLPFVTSLISFRAADSHSSVDEATSKRLKKAL